MSGAYNTAQGAVEASDKLHRFLSVNWNLHIKPERKECFSMYIVEGHGTDKAAMEFP